MAAEVETPPAQAKPGTEPMGPTSIFIAVLTAVFWGATAISNQLAMDVIPPLLLGGIRFLLAAVFMFVWCLKDADPVWLKPGQWKPAWVMGILLFLQIGTFNVGANWTTTSHASILVNSYIFWVAIVEVLWFRTIRMRSIQWVGLVMASIGCGWVLLNQSTPDQQGQDTPSLAGDLVLAASGFILAVKTLYAKHAVRSVAPGTLILWHDVIGALIFFAVSPLVGERITGTMTPVSWVAMLYAGFIVSGYCFGANATLLRRHGASQVSVFSFLSPIIGVALGVCFRGDELTIGLLIGALLVTTGIYLTNKG
ncbi:DMT family transporter [Planctomicrobium sp. SH668]|uniref:DMT family transporter n=1 Tax=Planctomicrobium sp. SH668 TaxID=3448126 RepID=UPI003F5BB78A